MTTWAFFISQLLKNGKLERHCHFLPEYFRTFMIKLRELLGNTPIITYKWLTLNRFFFNTVDSSFVYFGSISGSLPEMTVKRFQGDGIYTGGPQGILAITYLYWFYTMVIHPLQSSTHLVKLQISVARSSLVLLPNSSIKMVAYYLSWVGFAGSRAWDKDLAALQKESIW